jgi:hypothetical protein
MSGFSPQMPGDLHAFRAAFRLLARMAMRTWLSSFLFVGLMASRASAQEASVVNPVTVRAGEIECTVTDHGAIPDGDARTAADLLCGELLERGSPPERYEIRFGKLDSNVLVTVTRASRPTSRRLLLSSLSEMTVGAQRLAIALITDKPIGETEGADNVVASEARRPTTKNGTLAGTGELIAQTQIGTEPGLSGGFGLGLDYRLQNVAIAARARFGGIGESSHKLSFAVVDIGGRIYALDGATAPFAGVALSIAHWDIEVPSIDGSGIGAVGEIGIEAMRNAKVGLSASIRADLPFFALERTWVMPLSFNLGMAFR